MGLDRWMAAATGDPHFDGFDGESFDFMGEREKIYNLLSDHDVQVNARFGFWPEGEGATCLDRIGILAAGHKIQFGIEDVTIDDYPVRSGRMEIALGIAIETIGNLNSLFLDQISRCTDFYRWTLLRGHRVTTPGYNFVVILGRCGDDNPLLLNILCEMTGKLWPHGVIGQTADHDGVARQCHGRNGEGVVEGVYQDYEVSSLWASDFKFNRYRERVPAPLLSAAAISSFQPQYSLPAEAQYQMRPPLRGFVAKVLLHALYRLKRIRAHRAMQVFAVQSLLRRCEIIIVALVTKGEWPSPYPAGKTC